MGLVVALAVRLTRVQFSPAPPVNIVYLQYKKASGTYELIPRLDVLAEIKNYFKKSVDTDNTIHYN